MPKGLAFHSKRLANSLKPILLLGTLLLLRATFEPKYLPNHRERDPILKQPDAGHGFQPNKKKFLVTLFNFEEILLYIQPSLAGSLLESHPANYQQRLCNSSPCYDCLIELSVES